MTVFAVLFHIHFVMDTNIYCSFRDCKTSKITKRGKMGFAVTVLFVTVYVRSYVMLCV